MGPKGAKFLRYRVANAEMRVLLVERPRGRERGGGAGGGRIVRGFAEEMTKSGWNVPGLRTHAGCPDYLRPRGLAKLDDTSGRWRWERKGSCNFFIKNRFVHEQDGLVLYRSESSADSMSVTERVSVASPPRTWTSSATEFSESPKDEHNRER